MSPNFNVCPEFWKDIKFLRKKTKNRNLLSDLDDFENHPDENKIASIPIIKAIAIYIEQTSETVNDTSDPYDRQPFLGIGWKIYKLKYAFDKRGKSKGLRIIFCKKGEGFLLVYINQKCYCSDERSLEKEFLRRIKTYLTYQS